VRHSQRKRRATGLPHLSLRRHPLTLPADLAVDPVLEAFFEFEGVLSCVVICRFSRMAAELRALGSASAKLSQVEAFRREAQKWTLYFITCG